MMVTVMPAIMVRMTTCSCGRIAAKSMLHVCASSSCTASPRSMSAASSRNLLRKRARVQLCEAFTLALASGIVEGQGDRFGFEHGAAVDAYLKVRAGGAELRWQHSESDELLERRAMRDARHASGDLAFA